jgi:hypothetical protein
LASSIRSAVSHSPGGDPVASVKRLTNVRGLLDVGAVDQFDAVVWR